MTRTCLNPACDTAVITIGVCVTCANDRHYKPKRDGAGDHEVPDPEDLLPSA